MKRKLSEDISPDEFNSLYKKAAEQLPVESTHVLTQSALLLQGDRHLESRWKATAKRMDQKTRRYQFKDEMMDQRLEVHLEVLDKRFYSFGMRSFRKNGDLHPNSIFTVIENYVKYDALSTSSLSMLEECKYGAVLRSLTLKIYASRYPDAVLTTIIKMWQTEKRSRMYSTQLFEGITESIDSTWRTVKATFNSYYEALSVALEQYVSRTMLVFMLKIMGAIFLISLVSCSVSYLITFLWSKYVDSRESKEEQKPSVVMEEFGKLRTQGLEVESKSTVGILAIGRTVFSAMNSVEQFDPEKFLSRFGRMATSFNSIERCLVTVWSFIVKVVDYVCELTTGEPYFEAGMLARSCSKDMTRLAELSKQYSLTPSFLTAAVSKEVNQITHKYKLLLAGGKRTLMPAVWDLYSMSLLSCADLIAASTNFEVSTTPRVRPLWIHITGKSGIGKTAFISQLVSLLYTVVNKEPSSDPATLIHPRNVVSEYWDGYHNQFAVQYDDFMQSSDLERRRLDALELISVVTNAPLSLNMAKLELKACTAFTSKVVITTSNMKTDRDYLPDNLGLIAYEALYRRMAFRLSYDRVGDEHSFTNITSPTSIGRTISLNELLAACTIRLKEYEYDFRQMMDRMSPEKVSQIVADSLKVDYDHAKQISHEFKHPIEQGVPHIVNSSLTSIGQSSNTLNSSTVTTTTTVVPPAIPTVTVKLPVKTWVKVSTIQVILQPSTPDWQECLSHAMVAAMKPYEKMTKEDVNHFVMLEEAGFIANNKWFQGLPKFEIRTQAFKSMIGKVSKIMEKKKKPTTEEKELNSMIGDPDSDLELESKPSDVVYMEPVETPYCDVDGKPIEGPVVKDRFDSFEQERVENKVAQDRYYASAESEFAMSECKIAAEDAARRERIMFERQVQTVEAKLEVDHYGGLLIDEMVNKNALVFYVPQFYHSVYLQLKETAVVMPSHFPILKRAWQLYTPYRHVGGEESIQEAFPGETGLEKLRRHAIIVRSFEQRYTHLLSQCAFSGISPEDRETFNTNPLLMAEKYPHQVKAIANTPTVRPETLMTRSTDYSEVVDYHRKTLVNGRPAHFVDPLWKKEFETNPTYVKLRIGEMFFHMFHKDLSMIESEELNCCAVNYGIRVLSTDEAIPSPVIYIAQEEQSPKPLAYNWIDQAIWGWTDPSVRIHDIEGPAVRYAMKDRSWKQFFHGEKKIMEPITVHPKPRLGFASECEIPVKIYLKETTQTFNRRMILAGKILAGVAVVGAVAGIAYYLFQSFSSAVGVASDVYTQSWDPKSDKMDRKFLKRRPRTKVVLAKKNSTQAMDNHKNVYISQLMTQSAHINPILPKVTSNIEIINFLGEGVDCVMFGTFLCSNVFACASHVFKNGIVKELKFLWARDEKVGNVVVKNFSVKHLPGRDVSLVTVHESGLPMYKDLRKHLFNRDKYPRMLSDIVRVDFLESGNVVLDYGKHIIKSTSPLTVSHDGTDYVIDGTWVIQGMAGQDGDCGLVFLTPCASLEKRILGIHVAGGEQTSVMAPIFIEDLCDVKEVLSTQGLSAKDIWPEDVADINLIVDTTKFYRGLRSCYRMEKNGKPHTPYAANKTKIKPTNLTDLQMVDKVIVKPFVCTTAPVRLQKYMEGDVLINPFENAMARFAAITRNDLGIAIPYKKKHFKGILGGVDLSDWVDLTEKEVINGLPGARFVGPMDLSNSAAAGFSDQGEDMSSIVEGPDGDRRFSRRFKRLLDRYYKKLAKGKSPPLVCIATMKDECKNVKKIGKPRIFTNAAKVMLALCKQVAGGLFEKILSHTGERDVYVGLNVHGFSWKLLYDKLRGKSKEKIIADDIEGFDMHMRLCFCKNMYKALLDYGASPKQALRFYLLMYSVLCPYIILGARIFQYLGMSSGSYFTAMINSMYNSWMQRVLWDMRNPFFDFDEFVSQATFGDDLIQAVSDAFPEESWNGQILADLRWKFFNVNTTSILKDGGEVLKFMKLDCLCPGQPTAQFLRRQFFVQEELVYPVLSKESIDSMLTWVRPTAERSMYVCLRENVDTALRELCYYPRNIFDLYYHYFAAYFSRNGWPLPDVDYVEQRMKYFKS